ncbi:MAG: cell envelope biogenesis protein TolA, partial [Lysobacterales bacterium]
MSNLIPIESVNALQLFTIDGIDSLLKQIEDEVSDFEADVATVKGRQEIKSTAYKVTLSKGVIDTAGKDLVADWKKKAAVVDESRRKARAFLDDLSTKVRQPLTAWEQEQAAIEAAKRLVDQVAALHEEALAMNDLFDREREVQAREAELQKQQEAVEAQRKADEAKAEAARIAQERAKAEAERQARVQAEADAKAKL